MCGQPVRGLGQPLPSRVADQRGLVDRTPHEWHRNVLETRLTESGHAALKVADERATEIESRIAEEFTPEERAALKSLLARCVEAIHRA